MAWYSLAYTSPAEEGCRGRHRCGDGRAATARPSSRLPVKSNNFGKQELELAQDKPTAHQAPRQALLPGVGHHVGVSKRRGSQSGAADGWTAFSFTQLYTDESLNYRFKIGEGAVGRVVVSGNPEYIHDVATTEVGGAPSTETDQPRSRALGQRV